MVILEKTSWMTIIFSRHGSVLNRIWKRVLAATIFATVITLLYDFGPLDKKLTFTILPFQLIGLALAIFLGFRNNSSYDRFWEGRKLWGRMINITRTLTRQIMTLTDPRDGDLQDTERDAFRREMVHRLIAYLHAFRHHLRVETDFEDCHPHMNDADYERLVADPNPPIFAMHRMGERFRDAWRSGWIDTFHLPIFETSLTTMTDIQGGCERIKKTPIPFAYTILMHRIVGIYCFSLPFGVYGTIGDLTPVVVLLISYSFFGLDAIGEEIEEPFGTDPNDLPLSAFCNMLEREALTRIEETDNLPTPSVPTGNILT